MSITRETIVADFKLAFGAKAETVYANLRDDYTSQLPNTSLFTKRSTHQGIIALIESATKHKPNAVLAKYWNGVYSEFIKRCPNKMGLESEALESREIVLAMTDEEAAAFAAENEKVEAERNRKSEEAQAKYSAQAAALLGEETSADGVKTGEDDILF